MEAVPETERIGPVWSQCSREKKKTDWLSHDFNPHQVMDHTLWSLYSRISLILSLLVIHYKRLLCGGSLNNLCDCFNEKFTLYRKINNGYIMSYFAPSMSWNYSFGPPPPRGGVQLAGLHSDLEARYWGDIGNPSKSKSCQTESFEQ